MRLLRPEDVAEQLGVTRRWVIAAAREGRLPYVRVGRYPRFTEEDIAAWVEANRAGHGRPRVR